MPKRISKAGSHFDALFGARQGEQLAGGLKLIPRQQIERSGQPRQSFPSEEISELAASLSELRQRGEGIEGTGFLQPILVTQQGDSYRLIAGERRYRASEQAGIELLPAVVVALGESSVLLAQLIENLQRRDLPPLEEARGLRQLMSEQGLSLREAARVLGKGKGYVENRLNLLRMGADVQEMVSVQTDTLLHARDIDGVSNPQQRQELIRAVLENGLSRTELRQRIHPDSQVLEEEAPTGEEPGNQEASGGEASSTTEKESPQEEALLSVRTDNQAAPEGNAREAQLSEAQFPEVSPQIPARATQPGVGQSVLLQLRPAAALAVEAHKFLQKNLPPSALEVREVEEQLRILEEQIQLIRAQLQATE